MKELIKELKSQGITCSYESHVEVEPAGIIAGLFLISIPVVFWYFFDFFTPIYLLPALSGIYLVSLGLLTLFRNHSSKR